MWIIGAFGQSAGSVNGTHNASFKPLLEASARSFAAVRVATVYSVGQARARTERRRKQDSRCN